MLQSDEIKSMNDKADAKREEAGLPSLEEYRQKLQAEKEAELENEKGKNFKGDANSTNLDNLNSTADINRSKIETDTNAVKNSDSHAVKSTGFSDADLDKLLDSDCDDNYQEEQKHGATSNRNIRNDERIGNIEDSVLNKQQNDCFQGENDLLTLGTKEPVVIEHSKINSESANHAEVTEADLVELLDMDDQSLQKKVESLTKGKSYS